MSYCIAETASRSSSEAARSDYSRVLCYNDLGQQSVIVDEKTHKVNITPDREYARFYPPEFNDARYLRPGPSGALEGKEDGVLRLLEVLGHKH